MSELSIQIKGIGKIYRLGSINNGTFRADVKSYIARKLKKQDPNIKIGKKIFESTQYFSALKDINIDIKQGEAIGLIGGNGAGKSTLLKLICRITSPTEGEIYINGKITSMLEVGTGFNPYMTGRENIYLNGAILGMSQEEINSKLEQIIDFSECREFIDTPVKRYSSGMYVKLAFSVAAHLDSDILIMDEVLAVGDVAFQKKCLAHMNNLIKNTNKTIIYVSHNLKTIEDLCKRCIVLEKGKKIFDGDVPKGIETYLRSLKQNEKNDIDLSSEKKANSKVYIKSLKSNVNSVNNYVELENVLELVLNTKSETINVRTIISTIDGTPIATSVSNTITIDNQMQKIKQSIDISNISPGHYSISVDIFKKSECLEKELDENLFSARDIGIIEIKSNGNARWNSKAWGNIKLPCSNIMTI